MSTSASASSVPSVSSSFLVVQTICVGLIVLMSIVGVMVYMHRVYIERNESEYQHIVEYQTMLLSALISQESSTQSLLTTIPKIRFFPDQSGSFVILNTGGKILTQTQSTYYYPVQRIVELAQSGGGWIRFSVDGSPFDCFVHHLANTDLIVCSGLYADASDIESRSNWKRAKRYLLKENTKPRAPMKTPQQSVQTD